MPQLLYASGGGAMTQFSATVWFLFGGMTDEGPSNCLWKYDADTNIWEDVDTEGLCSINRVLRTVMYRALQCVHYLGYLHYIGSYHNHHWQMSFAVV